MDADELLKTLDDIDGLPLFKNSRIYESNDWREFSSLTTDAPVQRKLTAHECVFDLDHVAPIHFETIPQFLTESAFKYIAWKSGPEGMHIHFWTNITGKEAKKKLTELMAQKLEEIFGVKNDLGPMGHGHIRCEFSFHPKKDYQKVFLRANLSTLFPFNDINPNLLQKVLSNDLKSPLKTGKVTAVNGKIPTCMKFILENHFSDGRERLLFSLISWNKASGMTDDENYKSALEWCNKQNYKAGHRALWAKVKSSGGKVGCTYRHSILEEIGCDIGECKWE